jgi:tetratricopeptide (TPR) repeat protein
MYWDGTAMCLFAKRREKVAFRWPNNLSGHLAPAIESDRLSPEGFASRGAAHLEMGEYARAIDDYSYAVILNPKNRFYFSARGLTGSTPAAGALASGRWSCSDQ